MSKTRNLSDLLDANGDVKSGALDNVPASDLVNDTSPQLGGNLDCNTFDISWGDNEKARFGNADDLEIYHDGSHSFIKDSGTGDLRILANDFVIRNSGNTQSLFYGNGNTGAVSLYHGGSTKLATTSSGATVTGTLTATAFSGDGSALTNVPAGVSNVNTVVVTSSGTYTPTSGTKFVTVYACGGGGGGGGLDVNNQDQYEGSGGNGGNTAVKTYNATELGANASITIGSGGSGGSSSGNNGSTGGNTSFNPAGTGSTVTGAGGYGGYGISNDGGAAFNNTYNTGNSNFDYVIFGEICHRGGSLRQGSTRYIMGAIGGRSYFGRGGQGVSAPTNTGGASANGNDGERGGGGSAGVNFQQNGVNKSGGNGGNGIVVIEEYA